MKWDKPPRTNVERFALASMFIYVPMAIVFAIFVLHVLWTLLYGWFTNDTELLERVGNAGGALAGVGALAAWSALIFQARNIKQQRQDAIRSEFNQRQRELRERGHRLQEQSSEQDERARIKIRQKIEEISQKCKSNLDRTYECVRALLEVNGQFAPDERGEYFIGAPDRSTLDSLLVRASFELDSPKIAASKGPKQLGRALQEPIHMGCLSLAPKYTLPSMDRIERIVPSGYRVSLEAEYLRASEELQQYAESLKSELISIIDPLVRRSR